MVIILSKILFAKKKTLDNEKILDKKKYHPLTWMCVCVVCVGGPIDIFDLKNTAWDNMENSVYLFFLLFLLGGAVFLY